MWYHVGVFAYSQTAVFCVEENEKVSAMTLDKSKEFCYNNQSAVVAES